MIHQIPRRREDADQRYAHHAGRLHIYTTHAHAPAWRLLHKLAHEDARLSCEYAGRYALGEDLCRLYDWGVIRAAALTQSQKSGFLPFSGMLPVAVGDANNAQNEGSNPLLPEHRLASVRWIETSSQLTGNPRHLHYAACTVAQLGIERHLAVNNPEAWRDYHLFHLGLRGERLWDRVQLAWAFCDLRHDIGSPDDRVADYAVLAGYIKGRLPDRRGRIIVTPPAPLVQGPNASPLIP